MCTIKRKMKWWIDSSAEPMDAERLKFMRKYCKDCIYFVRNADVGMGRDGGYCDYLGITGHSRIAQTPPELRGKACTVRQTRDKGRKHNDQG